MKNWLNLSFVLCPLSLLLAATIQPVELPPFTFAGRIVDYAHVAYGSEAIVEVRVKAKDGTLLAKTKTATLGNTAYNYALDVPLASQAIEGHVSVGDAVVFEFVDPDGRVYAGLVSEGDATVGRPGDVKKVNVILASDANGDGVADEYVETLEYLMWKHGIETYDANADYDKDGQSNYAEYVAGTNPFDKTDRFSVREMATKQDIDGYLALKVLVSQGRTYTVSTSGRIGKDVTDWVKTEFAVNDPTAVLQGRLSTGPSEVGYRVIYVKKDGASRFWRMEVE